MQSRLEPTPHHERIMTLDVLRGFALVGILMANMTWFKTPQLLMEGQPGVRVEPIGGMLDEVSRWVIDLLATGSFYPLFSFLFGLGFYFIMQRTQEKGLNASRFFAKRMLFLLVIGLVHLVFLFSGDILVTYALAGLLLLLFQSVSVKGLIGWASGLIGGMLALISLSAVLIAALAQVGGEQYDLMVGQTQQVVDQAMVVYAQGSFGEITQFRWAHEVPLMAMNQVFSVALVLGVFLIGVYFGRKGVFEHVSSHLPFLRKIWWVSMGAAILLSVFYVWVDRQAELNMWWWALIEPVGMIAGLSLTFFYVSSAVFLMQKEMWRSLLSPVADAGRMALTHYLLQSVLMMLIFKGYGLGLYGQVGAFMGILICLVIFGVQVGMSRWWFRRFSYGPMEWVWRSLTYGQKQPMRR